MYNSFLYIVTVLVWGTSWFAIKFQVDDVPAIQSIFYRFLIAAFLLQVFLLLTGKIKIYTARIHIFFALMGLCLFCMNYVFYYTATAYGLTTGVIAVICSFLIPMNIFNNILFYRQKTDINVFIGTTLGFCGIAALFQDEIYEVFTGSNIGLGVLYSIIATYFASLGNMTSKKLQNMNVDVMSANGWGMSYGALILFIISILSTDHFQFSVTPPYLISLVFLSVVASIIAFGSYLTLLGRIGADRAAYTTLIFPVIALLLSSLFENYQWSVLKISGICFIILGNFIIINKKNIIKI